MDFLSFLVDDAMKNEIKSNQIWVRSYVRTFDVGSA